jgi:osmotically-inducible protein OsmY
MRHHIQSTAFATLALLIIQGAAWGQTSFGSRTVGSGSTGTTQSAQGSSAFGTSTTQNNTGGGTGGTSTNTSGTDFSSSSLGTQYLQQAQQAGFVGASSNNNGNSILGGVSAGTTTQNTGANNIANNANLNNTATNQLGNNTQQNNKISFRDLPAHLNISFDHPKATTQSAAGNVSLAIKRSLTSKQLPNSSITVDLFNGTATLHGSVASTHDRALAETLIHLEPGVWKVRNELEVTGASTETAAIP